MCPLLPSPAALFPHDGPPNLYTDPHQLIADFILCNHLFPSAIHVLPQRLALRTSESHLTLHLEARRDPVISAVAGMTQETPGAVVAGDGTYRKSRSGTETEMRETKD